jgi:hypothetical protein
LLLNINGTWLINYPVHPAESAIPASFDSQQLPEFLPEFAARVLKNATSARRAPNRSIE